MCNRIEVNDILSPWHALTPCGMSSMKSVFRELLLLIQYESLDEMLHRTVFHPNTTLTKIVNIIFIAKSNKKENFFLETRHEYRNALAATNIFSCLIREFGV